MRSNALMAHKQMLSTQLTSIDERSLLHEHARQSSLRIRHGLHRRMGHRIELDILATPLCIHTNLRSKHARAELVSAYYEGTKRTAGSVRSVGVKS
jgi:hypothetical protein